jgi:hypothetical protein
VVFPAYSRDPYRQRRPIEEALEWTRRLPAHHGDGAEGEIEIRQLFELEDFAPSEAVDRFRKMENSR